MTEIPEHWIGRTQTWDDKGDWVYANVTLTDYLNYLYAHTKHRPTINKSRDFDITTMSPQTFALFNRIVDRILALKEISNE